MDDQNDVVAQLATANGTITTLTTERDTARASITTITTERDTARASIIAVTAERDTARASVASLTVERDSARAQVTTATEQLNTANAEVTRLSAAQSKFDDRLRAELLKHGVRMEAVKLPAGDAANSKTQTLTEKMLAAKAAQKAS